MEFLVELVGFDAAGEGVAEDAAGTGRVGDILVGGAAGGAFVGGRREVARPEAFRKDCSTLDDALMED